MTDALNQLLKATSRSFYLTMRILPGAIRPQISLAYLLARMTDTIADTEIISVERRLEALEKLRARILGTSNARLDFGEVASAQGLPGEKILLERCEDALHLLAQFSKEDQKRIREVLNTITSGQELDLKRFAKWGETTGEPTRGDARPTRQSIIALQTEDELDDYTYRVAGCVGEFWTKICRTHLFPTAKIDDDMLTTNGIRFGKGLQLVNILRDLPRDLRSGRCYIPQKRLNSIGLSPDDLLSPSNEPKFRPLYQNYLNMAQDHLAAGWDYTNHLPKNHFRMRLACAWPILIGAKTLRKLRSENVLDPAQRVKIRRAEVRNIIAESLLLYLYPAAWKRQFTKFKG